MTTLMVRSNTRKSRKKSNNGASERLLTGLLKADRYKAAVRICSDLLSAEVASIFLVNPLDPERLDMVATTSRTQKELSFHFSGPREPHSGLTPYLAYWYRKHAEKNTPRVLSQFDLAHHPYVTKKRPKHTKSKRCISRLVFPLRDRKGVFFGLVTADNKVRFDGREPLLTNFSRADVRLAEAAKRTLEDAVELIRFFEIFASLGHSVAPGFTVDEMLGATLELAMALLKADRGDFVGPDRRFNKTICRVQRGRTQMGIDIGDEVPGESFIGHLLQSKQTYDIAGDVRKLPKTHYRVADPRTRSEIAIKFQTPQGRQFLLNLESFNLNFFDSEDVRFLSLLLPYVEARVAQAEGRETVALYKNLIVENLQEMVFVKDVAGRFVFVSPNLAKFLGAREPRDVIGKKDADFFKQHPEMVTGFLAQDEKVMKSGKESDWYTEPCQPDFQPEPWQIDIVKYPVFASETIADLMGIASQLPSAMMTTDDGRKVVGVLGIFHNVTKQAHLAKAQSLAKSGIVLWRKRTDRLDISDSMWEIFNISLENRRSPPSTRSSTVLVPLLTRIDPEDKTRLMTAWSEVKKQLNARRKARQNSAIRLAPLVFKLKNEARWFRVHYENSFEIENDRQTEYALVVVQDVTELQHSIRELQEAQERMERACESLTLSDLSREAFHDAEGPVNLLPAAVENIAHSLGRLNNLRKQERVGLIKKELKTLKLLSKRCDVALESIEYVRSLSKDPRRIRRDAISIGEVLQECEWAERPAANERGIRIKMDCDKTLPPVPGDKIALLRGFRNLLRNSIAYGCPDKSKKRITIKVRHDPNQEGVIAEIQDSGPGFSPEVIAHVKEPYSVAIHPKGKGFGLLNSKTLFKMMGGRLELFPGSGARCQIFLPQFKTSRLYETNNTHR